jgi:4-hydroxy-3-methylbut-2-en-1-yl diphosphate synthase IspG/GcpE
MRFWFAAKPARAIAAAGLQHFAGGGLPLVQDRLRGVPERAGGRCSILQTVTARIKARTEHLKGVKIAIMGCIVNGPGEMADADFGYVGGAPGKINLYVGKTAIKFNIPEAEAVDRLVDLIKEHGKWVEAEVANGA